MNQLFKIESHFLIGSSHTSFPETHNIFDIEDKMSSELCDIVGKKWKYESPKISCDSDVVKLFRNLEWNFVLINRGLFLRVSGNPEDIILFRLSSDFEPYEDR